MYQIFYGEYRMISGGERNDTTSEEEKQDLLFLLNELYRKDMLSEPEYQRGAEIIRRGEYK